MPSSSVDLLINILLMCVQDFKNIFLKNSMNTTNTLRVRGLAWLGSVPGVHEFRGSNLCLLKV